MPSTRIPLDDPVATPLGDFNNRQQVGVTDEQVLAGGKGAELLYSEEASEEEEALLEGLMDSVETAIHGPFREDLVAFMESTPDLWKTVGDAASMIISRAALKMQQQGQELPASVVFGENASLQNTITLLWEVADAIGHPSAEEEEQLEGAYFRAIQMLGEQLFEDDVASAEAQDLLLEMELGEGAGSLSDEPIHNVSGLLFGDE